MLRLVLFIIMTLKCSSVGAHFKLVDVHGETITEQKQGLLLFNGGTVCDGHFFGPTEVYAICREMGFDTEGSWKYGLEWPQLQNSLNISLADVHCLEPYWSMCSYVPTDPFLKKCTHDKDVLMTCKGSIISCPPGMYRSYRICLQCPSDTYKSVEGTETSCLGCPSSATSQPGSLSCSCKRGMFWNGTACLDCPEGTASKEGMSECVKCPSGSTTNHIGSSCSCPKGMIWSWDDENKGSCQQCLPGTYKNTLTDRCEICPSGTTSATSSEHCICEAGTYWNITACQDCSPGFASPAGALKCQECSSRGVTHQDQASTSCSCPFGKSWVWNVLKEGVGSCEFESSFTNTLLSCVVAALVVLCFLLASSLFYERRKNRVSVRRSTAHPNSKYGGFGLTGDQDSLITGEL